MHSKMNCLANSTRKKEGRFAEGRSFALKVKRFINLALLITLTVSNNCKIFVESFVGLTKLNNQVTKNNNSVCIGYFNNHST